MLLQRGEGWHRRRNASSRGKEFVLPDTPVVDHGPPEAWLGFLLNQLAAAVREETYRKLKSHRLSPRCFGLMLVLAECPGINQSDLGARIGVDSTTMSELVDELTVNGLITREINALDRRRKELVLTNEGHQSLSNAAITAAAVEKRLTGALAPTDVETLRDLLAKLLKSVNAHQKTPPRRNEH